MSQGLDLLSIPPWRPLPDVSEAAAACSQPLRSPVPSRSRGGAGEAIATAGHSPARSRPAVRSDGDRGLHTPGLAGAAVREGGPRGAGHCLRREDAAAALFRPRRSAAGRDRLRRRRAVGRERRRRGRGPRHRSEHASRHSPRPPAGGWGGSASPARRRRSPTRARRSGADRALARPAPERIRSASCGVAGSGRAERRSRPTAAASGSPRSALGLGCLRRVSCTASTGNAGPARHFTVTALTSCSSRRRAERSGDSAAQRSTASPARGRSV